MPRQLYDEAALLRHAELVSASMVHHAPRACWQLRPWILKQVQDDGVLSKLGVRPSSAARPIGKTAAGADTLLPRHAELISASMAHHAPRACWQLRPWILKQVQDDGVL
jgi:hypothetical protein